MTWGAVIGAAVSLVGTAVSADQAGKDRSAQKKAAKKLSNVTFDPKSITGPGGAGVTFGEEGTQFDLGGFQGIFDQFGDAASAGIEGGLDLQDASNQFLPGIFQGIGQAGQLSQEAFDRAGDLQFDGFQRGLQDQLFGGAGQSLNRLSGGFDDIQANTLNLLRQQAAPFEQRAFGNLQDNQFATGRLGSSGGALQTEAFARGLGQADTDRQLASFGEARNVQQSFQQLLQQQLGGGQGLAGQESDLLNSAFSQFGNTLGLANDLSTDVFNRGSSTFNQGFQGAGGQQALIQMLMGLGNFSGNLEQSRANTELQAKGGAAQAVSNFGAGSGDVAATFLGGLGQNIFASDSSGFGNPAATGGGVPFGGQPSTLGGFGFDAADPFAGQDFGV